MLPIRIVIADDHTLVRVGIRTLLQSIPGLEVVGEARDGSEALELIANLDPQVLLTDIAMPGMNGLVLAERVAKSFPLVRVVIISMHANEEFVGQAMKTEAAGYLLKDADTAELELAIRTVVRGESYLTPSVSTQVTTSYLQLIGEPKVKTPDPLTPRQKEILRLIAEGKTTKGIAHLLDISVKTVETHRAQITERLDIHDIPGLVRYAMRAGMVPLER